MHGRSAKGVNHQQHQRHFGQNANDTPWADPTRAVSAETLRRTFTQRTATLEDHVDADGRKIWAFSPVGCDLMPYQLSPRVQADPGVFDHWSDSNDCNEVVNESEGTFIGTPYNAPSNMNPRPTNDD